MKSSRILLVLAVLSLFATPTIQKDDAWRMDKPPTNEERLDSGCRRDLDFWIGGESISVSKLRKALALYDSDKYVALRRYYSWWQDDQVDRVREHIEAACNEPGWRKLMRAAGEISQVMAIINGVLDIK